MLTTTCASSRVASRTSACGVGVERRRDRLRIAQRLGGHPVLAIPAVEIAAEHPEAEREGAGPGVKERLLLDRIALNPADVAPRHMEPPASVEPYLAHAHGPVGDWAFVAARVTAEPIPGNGLDELRRCLSRPDLEDLREGGHWIILRSDVVSKPKVVSGFSRTMGGLETPLANKKPVHRLQQEREIVVHHEVQRLLGHDDFVRGDARDLRLVGLLRSLQPIG